MEDSRNGNNEQHILIFPFPASGHTKPLFCLAQLLCNAGLKVTLLNTDHNHGRIPNRDALAARFPSLRFESVPDGLPPDQPRNILDRKFHDSVNEFIPPLFRDLLVSYNGNGAGTDPGPSPVTCIITDVILRFPIEIAEELGIPAFGFSTFSARFLLMIFYIPKLLQDGQLPHPDGNTNQELYDIPGTEGLIRCKDLPGLWSIKNMEKNESMKLVNRTIASSRASGLIINTFDELEAPFLESLSKIYKKIYTIGPIHSLLKYSPCGVVVSNKEDHNCLAWLDSQSPRSVLFVSFGTLVKITSLQLIEFWNGLINSGKPFLLAMRSDLVKDDEKMKVVNEILETKSTGKWLTVGWAPQEEVLEHEAICAFLTHTGWNSTLESIAAGVPMITWPQISDQLSNATWVHKVWRIGFEMDDEFDRSSAEAMVRSIIEQKNEKVKKRIDGLAKEIKNIVSKDGIANQNLKVLVEDIKKIQLN